MCSFRVLFLASIFIVSTWSHYEDANPVVKCPAGTVKGSFLTSRLGRKFYSFRAIRYAKAPVGNLRFKPPVKYTWTGMFDGTEDAPLCPQRGYNNTSEDCLRLNVYAPKLLRLSKHPKLPVMFFIHDGGFNTLSGTRLLRGPEYLLDQDIVLVTINYRLGFLGFLSTGDAESPGNYGLKDQVLALKWVQKNIKFFGGDKNNVTVMGYSAGGFSIIYHMVSPMAKGLFHKAIVMSGTPLGPNPIPHDQLDYAQKLASLLGCPTDTSKRIVDCLRTKSADEIANSHSDFEELGSNPILIMQPVIENDCGQERYLTDHPIKLIEEKKFFDVPMVIGINKDELTYKAYEILNNATALRMANDDFEKYAPIVLSYERNTEKSKTVTRGIKSFYMHDQPLNNASVDGLGQAYADSIIGFATVRTVELLAKNGRQPIYYYKVTKLGGISNFYLPGSNDSIPYGVVHQDELIYLFYITNAQPLFDESYPIEGRVVDKLTRLLANFATTGNPTPQNDALLNYAKWIPFDVQGQKYMDIGKILQMKARMFEERYNFWQDLYPISDYL